MTLEDAQALRAIDRSGLLDAFLSLPEQFAQSFPVGLAATSLPRTDEVRAVLFCAMGGSAAPGDLIAAAFRDRARIPMVAIRGYDVPAHATPETLVVCVSYSGSTEETLSAFRQARDRGCPTVAICSGGALAEEALQVVRIPSGLQPRAALGHLAGATLGVLAPWWAGTENDGAIGEEVALTLGGLASRLGPETPAPENEAKDVAAWLGERVPVIWGSEGVAAAAAWRWRCAFSENAKAPAFSSELPELDHHEVAGWAPGSGERFALIVLRHDGEHTSVGPRLRATLEAIEEAGLLVREVRAAGDSDFARGLGLMLLGDAVSTYHALARGVDPTPIHAIDRVKESLARETGP
ncbi:MAG: bifunctional phosphoglucose/phosphomannose isomerase [Actinomycetota bacterium]